MARFLPYLMLLGFLCIGVIAAVHGGTQERVGELQTIPLTIKTEDGRRHEFRVEVAKTDAAKAHGLMYREEMAQDHGMLFYYEDVAPRSYWMRNTYLPLDIVFLDKDNKILNIGKGEPLNEASVPSDGPAGHVIEFNQGTMDRLDIGPGDQVVFRE